MKYFIESAVWVAGRLFALFAVTGILGGIFQDIPGVAQDPTGKATIGFVSRCFKWALTSLREYPLGVAIYFVMACILRMAVIYPHVEALKREVENLKSNKKLPVKNKRARVKSGRKRK